MHSPGSGQGSAALFPQVLPGGMSEKNGWEWRKFTVPMYEIKKIILKCNYFDSSASYNSSEISVSTTEKIFF